MEWVLRNLTRLKFFTSHINLYDLATLGTLFAGLTLALLLLSAKRVNQTANLFLSSALTVIVLYKGGLTSLFLAALGPLLYFYVRQLTGPELRFRWKDMLHFCPLLVGYWMPAWPALILVISYLYLAHRLIGNFYDRLRPVLMDRPRFAFRRLERALYLLSLLCVLSLLNDTFIFAIAFVLIGMSAEAILKSDSSAPLTMPITDKTDAKEKGRRLKEAVAASRLYEDAELTLATLAVKLMIHPHDLSRIINIGLDKNFSDFINEFRVRDVARKMQDPAHDRLTLLGIAYESGFNSKRTFNRVFKDVTGRTPVEYKNSLSKEGPIDKLAPRLRIQPLILRSESPPNWASEKLNRNYMFRNYLKIAWRNTLRSISYSAINMIGLAAGLCSFIVILLYMNYELSYDKWSPELNKVYHVSLREQEDFLINTPAPLAGFLAQKYPDAEAATMLQSSGDRESLLTAGENKLYQKNLVHVDSNFLKVFPYKLAQGNAATALNAPRTAILTRDMSRKLFGNEDPIGKQIKLNERADLVVTGVLEDQPGATHLSVSMLIHDAFGRNKFNDSWSNYSYQTYIKLKQPQSDAAIETAINRLYYNERLKSAGVSFENYTKAGAKTNLFVDQVPRIHNFPKHGSSNFGTVTILLVLAVLLLLAGAINFSNLAIAKSISRAKEVGIRKVMGSDRKQLILQFMCETAMQCLVSLVIAIMLLAVALPYINNSFHIGLGFFGQHETLPVVLQLVGCLLVIILLSGAYPSFYLSKFNAAKVLKGDYSTGKKGTFFRNSLIVVQFMVSVFFITCIIVIKSQMSFMQNRDRGFSGDQLVRLEARQETRENGFDNARNVLLSVPGVVSVAKTTKVPGDNMMFADTGTFSFKNNGKTYRMSSVKVSTDYFRTLRVPLKKGRLFTNEVQDQQTRTAIINESAAKKIGLPDPVGQLVTFPGCDSIPLRVVGVVKDFNVQGFEGEVQPAVFTIGNQACMFQSGGAMLVRLNSSHAQQAITGITQAWKKIEPAFPLRYSFVDQNFEQLFISYIRLEKIITFFGLIAIMISVMGLFALTAFFTRQRTKEVGVRKVLGATVLQLATLLSKDFIYLVLLSVFMITPFTWWAMQKWLQTFAYRIDISWWIFFVAGVTAIVIAVITVSFQSIKAALTNPADSLRSE